jgi:Zn-dependent M28 family amino/carboxypeptidase
MRHISLKLLLALALLSPGVLAQQRQPQRAGAEGSAPDIERLRAHVVYLASDKMEGRRTGTAGAQAAAAYIAAEFARLGLRAAGDTARVSLSGDKASGNARSYMQSFPYVAGVEAGNDNSMIFTTRAPNSPAATLDLRLKEDWMPLGFTTNAQVENLPVAFVGYGIRASELKHDDYEGLDARGGIVLALAGTPDGDNPHGQLARYAETRLKAAAAREQGAKALVIVAGEEDFRESRLAQMRYDNAGDAGLSVVAISRASARRILSAGGVGLPLEEIERALRASHPPAQVNDRTHDAQAVTQAHDAKAATKGHDAHAATQAHDATQAHAAPAQATEGGQTSDAKIQSPARKSLSVMLQNVALSIKTDVVRREAPASNVVGILDGSDAQLKQEAVVVGAHYDHLGRGGAGSLAAREGEIHHGADDNASGTSALLELARIFSQPGARPRRTVVFIAFGGEEEGLLGSSFYVRNPSVPLAQTVAMINMDMIGRLKDGRLIIGGAGTAAEWRGLLEETNTKLRLTLTGGAEGRAERGGTKGEMPVVTGANGRVMATASNVPRFTLALNDDGFGPSDHSSFYAQKIPVLFFFTGTHEDYHKPSDTPERINYEGEARIIAFVRDVVAAIDAQANRPAYAVARSSGGGEGRNAGFRVYLGTVPSYAETTDGLRLDAVREDSPAARAGLRAGDRITRLAGREVRNVYDYTYILAGMRAGQEYDVEVVREGNSLRFKITPAARK